jgi:cellulose synthase subunit
MAQFPVPLLFHAARVALLLLGLALCLPGTAAASSGAGPAPPPAAPSTLAGPSGPAPAPEKRGDWSQDVRLAQLGLPAQTAYGPHGSIAVSMPPPLGPLAGSGSFLRVFFAHSPLVDPSTSTLTLAVNGRPLSALTLDGSTAAGSTFEAPVPAFLLSQQSPNLVEARFELLAGPVRRSAAGAAPPEPAYARIDPQSYVHYQLYGSPGSRPTARLEGYPLPFAGRGGLGRVGLLLPSLPSSTELTAAFRLAADLGRRAYGQELAPQVVTGGHAEWLQSSATPALVVGTAGRLPVAAAVLRAAGFSESPAWSGPAGESIALSDGLLVPVVSPWDGSTPILLVSGLSEDGVGRAVARLTADGEPAPAGRYVIVRSGAEVAQGFRRAPQPRTIQLPRPVEAESVRALGAGSHTFSFPFLLPPLDAHRAGSIQLRLTQARAASGRSSVSLSLNDRRFAAVPQPASSATPAELRLGVPGALFRPGLNTLTVELQVDPEAGAPGWIRLEGAGLLTLPPPPSGGAGLERLPYPVFDDPAGVQVVVPGREPAWLSAAASALVGLGSRAGWIPPLEAAVAGEQEGRWPGRRSLLAIGVGGTRALQPFSERLARPPLVAGEARGWASMSQRPLTSWSTHHGLWLEGSGPELVGRAAGVLYRHPLPGTALGVDADGRSWPLEPAAAARIPEPPLLPALRWLIGLSVSATIFALGWQIFRPAPTRP